MAKKATDKKDGNTIWNF